MRIALCVPIMILLLTSCASPSEVVPERPEDPPRLMDPIQEGVLLTWRGEETLGRERFEDDGELANSLFSLEGAQGRARIWRDTGLVRVEIDDSRFEHVMSEEVLVLENGHWHAYAVVAELFAGEEEPREVTVVVPSRGASIPGVLTVSGGPEDATNLHLSLEDMEVFASITKAGEVEEVRVPVQGVTVRRRDAGPPPSPPVDEPPPDEEPLEPAEDPDEAVEDPEDMEEPADPGEEPVEPEEPAEDPDEAAEDLEDMEEPADPGEEPVEPEEPTEDPDEAVEDPEETEDPVDPGEGEADQTGDAD